MRASITTGGSYQADQASLTVKRQPTPCRPDRDAGCGGGTRQGNAIFQMRTKHAETGHGLFALLLVMGCKGGRRVILSHPDAPCLNLMSLQKPSARGTFNGRSTSLTANDE